MSWSKKEIPTAQFCNAVNGGVNTKNTLFSLARSKRRFFKHRICGFAAIS